MKTKNCLINFEDVVSGVVSSTDLVSELFNPFSLRFPVLFGFSGTGFGDLHRYKFCTLVRCDLPNNPGSVGVTTDSDGVFLDR
jgi:hypothetical protein